MGHCTTRSAWQCVFMTLYLRSYSQPVGQPVHTNPFMLTFTSYDFSQKWYLSVGLARDLTVHLSWYVDYISNFGGVMGVYKAHEWTPKGRPVHVLTLIQLIIFPLVVRNMATYCSASHGWWRASPGEAIWCILSGCVLINTSSSLSINGEVSGCNV